MFDRYCLGVDVSVWQSTINWETLYGNGVRFAIIKAAQGSYKRDKLCPVHLKKAKAAGVICGVYHWMDPANDPEKQVENLKAGLEEQDFSFLALDVEQYWSDWKEWEEGMISKRYSGKVISDQALACATLMRATFQRPVLIYTRASFVKDFAPEMSAWLPDWELWLAHYPYRSGRVRLTWEQLRLNYAPTLPSPSIPKGSQDWRFWQ